MIKRVEVELVFADDFHPPGKWGAPDCDICPLYYDYDYGGGMCICVKEDGICPIKGFFEEE